VCGVLVGTFISRCLPCFGRILLQFVLCFVGCHCAILAVDVTCCNGLPYSTGKNIESGGLAYLRYFLYIIKSILMKKTISEKA